MICTKCGKEINSNAKICPYCDGTGKAEALKIHSKKDNGWANKTLNNCKWISLAALVVISLVAILSLIVMKDFNIITLDQRKLYKDIASIQKMLNAGYRTIGVIFISLCLVIATFVFVRKASQDKFPLPKAYNHKAFVLSLGTSALSTLSLLVTFVFGLISMISTLSAAQDAYGVKDAGFVFALVSKTNLKNILLLVVSLAATAVFAYQTYKLYLVYTNIDKEPRVA